MDQTIKARRKGEDPFGLSFLDVLCCGLGAAVLLFLLVEVKTGFTESTLQRQLGLAERELAAARARAVEVQPSTSMFLESILAEEQESTTAGFGARLTVGPIAGMRRVVVLLDTSGSMANYYPREKPFESVTRSLVEGNLKWRQAVDSIAEVLLLTKGLEHFTVLALSDDQPGRTSGYPLVRSADGIWVEVSADNVLRARETLLGVVPAGGASHLPALASAIRLADPQAVALHGGMPADAIVLVTDGLPNHGPTPVGADDQRLHPSSGVVTPLSKRERANVVLRRVESMLGALPTAERPVIHVIALPWPDDAELASFALELVSIGRGAAMFPGIQIGSDAP